MKWMIIMLAVVSGVVLADAAPFPLSLPHVAQALEDWRSEFDDICGRTDTAMSLTRQELKELVERCDKLRPRIEKLDETTSKVFLRRLKMCRDLFQFMLEQPQK